MSRARIMVVGGVGSGKTTLIDVLNGGTGGATKTQSMEYTANSIDTPGEFVENPFFYKALFATSLEADIIVFVQDATAEKSIFPPGFAAAFGRRTMGVVTKTDHPEADVEKAAGFLKSLGLNGAVLAVSAHSGDGLEDLKAHLNWD